MNITVREGDAPLLSGLAGALCEALGAPPPGNLDLQVSGRLIDAGADPEDRLEEAMEAAGLRMTPIPASVVEARWSGDPLVARAPTSDNSTRWVALLRRRRRKLEVVIADRSGVRRRTLSVSEVANLLGLPDARTPHTFFQVEAALPLEGLRLDGNAHDNPWARVKALLRLERREVGTLILYAVVVGLLSLATPAAVQTLVNTVAFGTLLQPLIILTLMLLFFLALSGVLRVLQYYAIEFLQRRLFVRVALDLAGRLPRVDERLSGKYNMQELVNRFFDVVTVQKSAAKLLLDGLQLTLQTIIGMVLLALYHPLLLAFDVLLVLALVVVLVWMGRGAARTAMAESDAKYAVAAWLEDVASQPTLFRSGRGALVALERTNSLATAYLARRTDHFRVVLRQFIGGVGIQVVANTLVLGLGGWLVLDGQLTLGQLVAAELIVALVVAGVAKVGKQLETLYDLLAGLAKLGKLVDLPLDQRGDRPMAFSGPPLLTLSEVQVSSRCAPLPELALEPGRRVLVRATAPEDARHFLSMLEGRAQPKAGRVRFNAEDVRRLSPRALRDHIIRVSGPAPVGLNILEYLTLGLDEVRGPDVDAALEAVMLDEVVGHLPGGRETRMLSTGHPLTPEQSARLTLARALLGRPAVILLDDWMDQQPVSTREAVLERLRRWDTPFVLIAATHLPADESRWDDVIHLTRTEEA